MAKRTALVFWSSSNHCTGRLGDPDREVGDEGREVNRRDDIVAVDMFFQSPNLPLDFFESFQKTKASGFINSIFVWATVKRQLVAVCNGLEG
jgi:hypothetical protein